MLLKKKSSQRSIEKEWKSKAQVLETALCLRGLSGGDKEKQTQGKQEK